MGDEGRLLELGIAPRNIRGRCWWCTAAYRDRATLLEHQIAAHGMAGAKKPRVRRWRT